MQNLKFRPQNDALLPVQGSGTKTDGRELRAWRYGGRKDCRLCWRPGAATWMGQQQWGMPSNNPDRVRVAKRHCGEGGSGHQRVESSGGQYHTTVINDTAAGCGSGPLYGRLLLPCQLAGRDIHGRGGHPSWCAFPTERY